MTLRVGGQGAADRALEQESVASLRGWIVSPGKPVRFSEPQGAFWGCGEKQHEKPKRGEQQSGEQHSLPLIPHPPLVSDVTLGRFLKGPQDSLLFQDQAHS